MPTTDEEIQARAKKTTDLIFKTASNLSMVALSVLVAGIVIYVGMREPPPRTPTAEEQRIAEARAARDVAPGMTAGEVQASWGSPSKREHSDFAGGHSTDTWWFNQDRLVTFMDGRVTSVTR